MASIYKRDDSKYWWAAYRDARGKPVQKSTKTTDKEKAQKKADAWATEASDIREHRVDPRVEKIRKAQGKPLVGDPEHPGHVEAFRQHLEAKGDCKKHVVETINRLTHLIGQLDIDYPSMIDADAVKHTITNLKENLKRESREPRPISARTKNAYLMAMKSFTSWMHRTSLAHADPLAGVKGWNVEADRRLVRRDILPEEAALILVAAEAGEPWQKMTGADRAMLYRVAWSSGFRPNELRSLTRESFDLSQTPATATVAAAYSKHRRKDVQPLPDDLRQVLAPWLMKKTPGAPVFATMPHKTAEMFRHDLQVARDAWIAQASPAERIERMKTKFLIPTNERGEVAQFYSFRHSYVTQVVRAGTDVATAMRLSRHSTADLTVKRYAHTDLKTTVKAVPGIPRLAPAAPAEPPAKASA